MRSWFALFVCIFFLVFSAPFAALAATAADREQGISQPNQILIAQSDEKKPTDDDEEEDELDADDC